MVASGVYVLRVTAWPDLNLMREFTDWWSQVHESAVASPGFLGIGADQATEEGMSESILLSVKFDSTQTRDDWRTWLTSAQRDAGLQRPLEFTEEEERQSRRVSKIISSAVPAGHEKEFAAAQQALHAAAIKASGFVSIEFFPPAFTGAEWTTVLTFDSPEALQAWEHSPERAPLVERIRAVADQDTRSIPSGFAQWFTVSKGTITETPTWKQAMVVVAVLFAMVSILDMTLGDAIGGGWSIDGEFQVSGLGLPLPVTVFIGNAIGTILLTWFLMPWVTRWMGWWLDPGASRRTTTWGAVFLVGVYIVEIVVFGFINQALGI